MPLPNLFLVGPPKCGTTSLHNYLGQHPEVFMAAVKEPRFFGRDLAVDPRICMRDRAEYLRLFEDAGDARWRGEASVYYVYSRNAPADMLAMSPDARFVIVLRNPVDMVFSLHGQYVYASNETIEDFSAALAAEPVRATGGAIPKSAQFPPGLLYSQMGRYSEHVERYLDVAGRDRVFVGVFDDLVSDTDQFMRRLFRFLEVNDAVPIDLQVHNRREDKAIVNAPLRRFLRAHGRVASLVGRIPQGLRRRVRDACERYLFGRVTLPDQMPPSTRAHLKALFRPDVERLSHILDRDLTHWVANDADAPD